MIVGIIGGTGFVGKNLRRYLYERGIPVYTCSRHTGIDARNTSDFTKWINLYKVTHLVNLAAECGGIGLNQRAPATLWRATSEIAHSVLDVAVATQIEQLIMVGTVCSYSKDSPVPFHEDDLMRYGPPEPTNLAYGVAKLSSLYGAQAYAKEFGLKVVCLIPVNMYGPEDHFDLENSHVIPAIIRKTSDAIKQGIDVVDLWGSGKATREFLYVDDFCQAVKLALERSIPPDFINIGTGVEISIANIAVEIGRIMNFTGQYRWDSSKPDGQPRRCLSIDRAKKLLNYQPFIDFDTGLERTIKWYNTRVEKHQLTE